MTSKPKKRPISYSEINTHSRCEYQWELAYKRRIEPLMPVLKMDLGSAIHAGLEAYFKVLHLPAVNAHTIGLTAIEAWADAILPSWRDVKMDYEDETDRLGELMEIMDANPDGFDPDDIIGVSLLPLVERAQEVYTRTIRYLGNGWEVVMYDGEPIVERVFDWQGMTCHIDLVVREKHTGMVMVVDFKTKAQITPAEGAEYDIQTAIYQYILQQHGINATATAMLQIRSVTPKKPKLNKPDKHGFQSMSRSDIVTDWATYSAALVEAGLDPSEYGDMLMKLAGKKFFQLDVTYRGAGRLKAIWEKVVLPAMKEIGLSGRRKGGAVRSMSVFNCAHCRMNLLCMAELEGMDTRGMFGTMYAYKEDENAK